MINVNVTGIETTRREINTVHDRITDFRWAWSNLIDDILIPAIDDQFLTEGRGHWVPRQDSLPHPLLRKSGDLYRSWTGGDGNIDNRSALSLEFGSDLEYADVHEYGAGNIPARPVGDLADDAFAELVANFLDAGIQRSIA